VRTHRFTEGHRLVLELVGSVESDNGCVVVSVYRLGGNAQGWLVRGHCTAARLSDRLEGRVVHTGETFVDEALAWDCAQRLAADLDHVESQGDRASARPAAPTAKGLLS
jgi:hypothetical protein